MTDRKHGIKGTKMPRKTTYMLRRGRIANKSQRKAKTNMQEGGKRLSMGRSWQSATNHSNCRQVKNTHNILRHGKREQKNQATHTKEQPINRQAFPSTIRRECKIPAGRDEKRKAKATEKISNS